MVVRLGEKPPESSSVGVKVQMLALLQMVNQNDFIMKFGYFIRSNTFEWNELLILKCHYGIVEICLYYKLCVQNANNKWNSNQ